MDNAFRFDRNHFSILSFEQADKEIKDYSELSWQDRFRIHQYLNSIAYGYAGQEAPAMDKTIFSFGKTEDGQHIS